MGVGQGDKVPVPLSHAPEACIEISMPNNMLTEPINEDDDQQRISQAYDRITEFANKLMSGGATWKEEKKGAAFCPQKAVEIKGKQKVQIRNAYDIKASKGE